MRPKPLPDCAHVLRGNGRENQGCTLETFGVICGEADVGRDSCAWQELALFAILDQAFDGIFKRSPHRDTVPALGEQDGTDGRHRSVAENRYVLRHLQDCTEVREMRNPNSDFSNGKSWKIDE